jgi:hypothetical protein
LKPSSFRYLNSDNVNYGLIAEEVSKIDVHLATYEEDGTTPHGLDANALISVLIKAMQEVINKVDGMFTKVETKTLCLGTTCISEEQLKALLLKENIVPEVYTPTVSENIVSTTTDNQTSATTTATTTASSDTIATTTTAVVEQTDTQSQQTQTQTEIETTVTDPVTTSTPTPTTTPTPEPTPEPAPATEPVEAPVIENNTDVPQEPTI